MMNFRCSKINLKKWPIIIVDPLSFKVTNFQFYFHSHYRYQLCSSLLKLSQSYQYRYTFENKGLDWICKLGMYGRIKVRYSDLINFQSNKANYLFSRPKHLISSICCLNYLIFQFLLVT
jgi:hypothetical protein